MVFLEQRGKEEKGRLTRLDDINKLLTHSQHKDLLPEIKRLRFRHAERPGSTFNVTRVLPHGLDAALEKVHRVLQLEGVKGEGIEDLPERFGGYDVFLQEGEAAFVVLGLGVLVVIECPGVLEGRGAEVADEG